MVELSAQRVPTSSPSSTACTPPSPRAISCSTSPPESRPRRAPASVGRRLIRARPHEWSWAERRDCSRDPRPAADRPAGRGVRRRGARRAGRARARRAPGPARGGQDHHRAAAPARRAVARRTAASWCSSPAASPPGPRPGRMADLLGEEVGGTVGYRTRDERRVGPDTRIEVVTEGILTRRLQRDPSLAGHRPGGLRRDPRAQPPDRPGPRPRPRRPRGAAPRPAAPGHVGHPRRRPGGRAPRRRRRTRRRWSPARAARTPSTSGGARRGPARPTAGRGGRRGRAQALRRRPRRRARVPARRRRHPAGRRCSGGHAATRASTSGRCSARCSPGRAGPGPGPVAARAAPGRAGHRHRRDQPHRRRRADRGRRRPGPQAPLRRPQRADPAAHRAQLAGVGRPAGRAGRADRAGRGLPAVVRGRARRPAGLRPARRSSRRPGRPGARAGRVGHRRPTTWPSSTRRPPPALADAHELLRRPRRARRRRPRRPTAGRAMVDLPVHPRLARMVVAAADRGQGGSPVPGRPARGARRAAGPARRAPGRHRRPGPADRRPRGDATRPSTAARSQLVRRRATELRDAAGVPTRDRPGRRRPGAAGCRCSPSPTPTASPRPAAAAASGCATARRRRCPTGDPLAGEPFLVVADLDASAGSGPDGAGPSPATTTCASGWRPASTRPTSSEALGRRRRGGRDARLGRRPRRPAPARRSAGSARSCWPRPRARRRPATPRPPRWSTGSGPPASAVLGWRDADRVLQARVGFARRGSRRRLARPRRRRPARRPSTSGSAPGSSAPPAAATSSGSTSAVLRDLVGHHRVHELDRLVPTRWWWPAGGASPSTTRGEHPAIAVRVQELFGTTVHPTVADGRVPLVVHLLSPAGRPVQVTADLPGFWAGSWEDVRKDMAGRYPKHDWPLDPSTAEPRRPRPRPR